MHEMKFDMSGGAAVLEAIGAIARLGLPVPFVAVVGATENMPSGHAMKPGDIVRANRHDDRGQQHGRRGAARAGRLPGLRARPGAERLVDLATLTGGIVTRSATSTRA